MLKEFAKFVQSKTSFVTGTTLQVGHRPQSAPDRCSVILESVGGSPDFDLPDRIDKIFQIISRSEAPGHLTTEGIFDARDDAWEIFNALTGNLPGVLKSAQWTFPVVVVGVEYIANVIEALSDPRYMGTDEVGRFEYTADYLVKIRNV